MQNEQLSLVGVARSAFVERATPTSERRQGKGEGMNE